MLASGGHTSLLLCEDMGQHKLLGGTLDDALGEAFDKAARLLGLRSNSSGGAAIEAMARLYEEKYLATNSSLDFKHIMSVPMRDKPNCDFSYAGLKNAFRHEVLRARGSLSLDLHATNAPSNQMQPTQEAVALPEAITAYLCHSFQDVAFKHVEDRLRRALQRIKSSNTAVNGLVVVGGVASNLELRRRLLALLDKQEMSELPLIFPPISLCTDNGVMVAWAGIEKLNRGISNSVEGQEAVSRWPLGAPEVSIISQEALRAKV
jgi:N6-L-threonylcarbamoyladenine synthase